MDRDRSSRRDRDRDEDRHTTNDSGRRRRDSAPSRKRKDNDSCEPDRERPRRERKKLESGARVDSQSGAAPNGGAPAAVPSAYPVPSKVSSIPTTDGNGGVSIRSDDVTGKSSADGTANSSAGRSSCLNLDALAKAKTALQPRKELSEKLKRLSAIPNLDAVKRAQDLAAVPQRPTKSPVLRLDAQSREIDEHGNVISMTRPTNMSTLKVNINKQKKDAFQIIKPDLESLAKSTVHFDERMGINQTKLLRPKRPGFQFIEEGKLF